jgi:endonuclease/exonuclease/phosphatase family metal-dependent hydrolase
MKKTFLLCCVLLLFLTVHRYSIFVKEQLNTAAYHSTYFGKKFGRDLEFVTRPSAEKFSLKIALCIVTLPNKLTFGFAGLSWRTLFTLLNHAIPGSGLKTINLPANPNPSKTLTLMSFNTCLREGFFAPYTGGVVHPFEAVKGYASRIEALADWVGKKSPDIFIGQEFMSISAATLFIEKLKIHGYTSFIYDHTIGPLSVNSGLFAASKRPIVDVAFLCFPFGDKAGVAKFARMGAISFTVLDDQKKPVLRIYNTHLDPGPSQNVRERQLKKHLLPIFHLDQIPAILAGDLNFDTALNKIEAGLENLTNILEGTVTCSEEGKIKLRGLRKPNIEKIDGIIGNSSVVNFSNVTVEQVKSFDDILSDHFAVSTNIKLK